MNNKSGRCRPTQYFYDEKISKKLFELMNDNKKNKTLPSLIVTPMGENITKEYSFVVDLKSRSSSVLKPFDRRVNVFVNKSETMSVCLSRTTLKSPYFLQVLWYHIEILKITHVYVSFQNLDLFELKKESIKAREEVKRIGYGKERKKNGKNIKK